MRGHRLSLSHRSSLILYETQFGAVAVHDVVRHHARDARSGHVVEVALLSDAHGQTILGDKEVEELVTHRLNGDLRTVALSVGLEPALGGYCHRCYPDVKRDQHQSKYSFHHNLSSGFFFGVQ